ncbi:kinase-like domain-containing protein [Entophlyctis helioformis]|nr:kinase-like domain-containing protein [Entophlyctis helioformis]
MGAFQSQPESQPAAITVQASHSKELPWGHSQWDRLPAELRVMILKEASILTRFLVGMVPGGGAGAGAGKKTLDKATVQLIWQEVIDSDWQGDLNLLPEITLSADSRADSSMQLVRSDELFLRLCARFPDQADSADTKSLLKDTNAYSAGMVHIQRLTARLIHIPMHNGWFDLLDFDAYRIAFGWFAIIGGHTDLLRHLAKDHGVDLAQYGSVAYISAMDWAAYGGHVDILQMLHDAGNTTNKDDVIPPNASKVPESAILESQSSGSIDQAANSTIGKHLELSITNSSHAKPSICPAVPAIKDMTIDQLMIMHAAGTLPLMPRGDAPTTTLADAFGHDDCALVEPISPDFEPRTRPADYAMGDEIGEGGYGQVVAVTHIATQVQFACKVIAKITDVDDETYAWRQVRDAHEMLISKCAKAPHAIRTFDVMETKAFIFIVMERVNTVSDDRVFDKDESWRISRQLIECMHAFHKSGIYHHDIKDGNVLIDKDVNIRLIDFGLAVIGSPLEKLDHTVGTPMFMAPEIIFDETGHYGPGADVFSLGVVSFFLRFRYLPYRVQQHFALASSDSPFDMCDVVSSDYDKHSPFPMDTDQLDKDFFNQVLHGNPSNRLAMDGIVEHPWVTRDGLVPFVDTAAARPSTEPRPDDKTIGELLVLLDRLGMSGGTDGTKLGIEDVVEHLTNSAKADSAVRSVFLLLKAAKDGRAAFNNAVQAERERAALAVLDAVPAPCPETSMDAAQAAATQMGSETTLDGACPVSVQGGSAQQMPEHESGTCQDTPPKER